MRNLVRAALLGAVLVATQFQTAQSQTPAPAVPEAMPFDVP
jgi:hypothetical protein